VTVRSHAREILVHHIEIDDDGWCFEFGNEHEKGVYGTISNGASCFDDLRVTISLTSIVAW
jgi:hypothetical protein